MNIKLIEWGEKHFRPCPSIRQLREFAKSGQIVPPPFKAGRAWMVDENAQFIPIPATSGDAELSDRAASIYHAA